MAYLDLLSFSLYMESGQVEWGRMDNPLRVQGLLLSAFYLLSSYRWVVRQRMRCAFMTPFWQYPKPCWERLLGASIQYVYCPSFSALGDASMCSPHPLCKWRRITTCSQEVTPLGTAWFPLNKLDSKTWGNSEINVVN